MDDKDYRAQISNAYLPNDFPGIPGFPNHEPYLQDKGYVQYPIFCGNGDSDVCHIISFLSFVNKLNMLHRDNMMRIFADSLEKKAWIWFCGLPDKCITSLEDFCAMFFERWHNGEGNMVIVVERALTYLKGLKEPMTSIIDEHTEDDLIEELHEEPMIEHIVEDSSDVTITENIEDLSCSQVCCNANIFPEIHHEETITEINTYE